MGVKKIHEGETCIVMGNGPSLNSVPKEFLDSYITFGSNKIYALPYRPDYYCIIDKYMLQRCLPKLREGWRPKKQMFLRAEACIEDNYPIYPIVHQGFSIDINNCVIMGGTVTYAMFQIANYLGFKKILLVGVDHYYPNSYIEKLPGVPFKASDNDPDHFVCEDGKPYFTPGETYARPQDTTLSYEWAKEFFDELGVKVINLTEGTKLDVFEKESIENITALVNTTTINGIELIGRFAVGSEGFIDFLSRYIEGTKDYIEIGTLFGGSAIIAGLNCSGKVYCIDPLDGYYGTGKPDTSKLFPSAAIVKENWAKFGLAPERLEIFEHKHPPFPPELDGKRFDVAYIDGDHTEKGCRADWLALKNRVDKYIIFDNTEKETVKCVFAEAQESEDWEFVEEIGDSIKTGVLRKRSNK